MKYLLINFSITVIYAQVDTVWTRRYNGSTNGTDDAYAIAVDRMGNVYVAGKSASSGSGSDFITIKYNASGIEQWVRRFNGIGNADDIANAIAVDDSGNVYVTGQSNTGQYDDYLTIKYNTYGDTLWFARYDGTAHITDNAHAIALDNQGNIYVTGTSMGSGTSFDYLTIKYNPAGIAEWISRYNGQANDYDNATAIAVDSRGFVYVTGHSESTSTHTDYLTIKYGIGGIPEWIKRYNGPGNYVDEAYAIAVDNQGNVYITGGNYSTPANRDYVTIKYDSLGTRKWIGVYNGTGNDVDYAKDLAVDQSGNVCVTGWASMTGYARECVTIKYNPNGDTVWTRRYGGSYDQWGNSITVDTLGNIYVTGEGTYLSTSQDFITIKYSPSGIQLWDIKYNGTGNSFDVDAIMTLDNQNNIYVTGCSQGSGTGRDLATVKYVQTAGIEESQSPMIAEYVVHRVEPNPFCQQTTIQYTLYKDSKLSLSIYDITGKLVNNLVNQPLYAGIYNTIWDGRDDKGQLVNRGVYFYVIKTENKILQNKILFLF
jgi:uncharacterized delta-60 repeat protein